MNKLVIFHAHFVLSFPLHLHNNRPKKKYHAAEEVAEEWADSVHLGKSNEKKFHTKGKQNVDGWTGNWTPGEKKIDWFTFCAFWRFEFFVFILSAKNISFFYLQDKHGKIGHKFFFPKAQFFFIREHIIK